MKIISLLIIEKLSRRDLVQQRLIGNSLARASMDSYDSSSQFVFQTNRSPRIATAHSQHVRCKPEL